ncbi:MAG: VanW family protein [Anaerovoracaceae bacterium]|jgi:vancomycin resistance protein VanW
MKTKIYIILIISIILAIISTFTSVDSEINKTTAVDSPSISGIIYNLPWDDDAKFLISQKENNSPVLMAAYCTVFNDPSPDEESNVKLAADYLSGSIISPGEVFSQNEKLGPYTEEKGYKAGQSYLGSSITKTVGGGVCKVATTLYNVSVAAGLEVVERYNHFMPVSYVPHGQDATVSYGSKDLKFRNNTEEPILIWAKGIGNKLYIAFYGKKEPPDVEWGHQILNRIEAPKDYVTNTALPKGEERIIVEGADGLAVESWITFTYADGKKEIKSMGISQYWPMPYLIEINE